MQPTTAPAPSVVTASAPSSASDLLARIYSDLRRVAAAKMARERPGQTLQPTAIVHEVWIRLGADRQPVWQNEAHFFAAAAETMRRILIDRARQRRAVRHGGEWQRADAECLDRLPGRDRDDELLFVHEALDKFALTEPRKAALVQLRYFGGLTLEEAAAALDVPFGSAKRWWIYARAWLHRELTN